MLPSPLKRPLGSSSVQSVRGLRLFLCAVRGRELRLAQRSFARGLCATASCAAGALVIATATASGEVARPTATPVPVLSGTWTVTGTVVSDSDPSFLGPSYAVGANFKRSWKFAQDCSGSTCVTDLIRVSDLGEVTTRISYGGNNNFTWRETQGATGFCNGQTIADAGTIQSSWLLNVKTVARPGSRPVATSLTATADFVYTVNQQAFASLGCSAPAQVTYRVAYVGDSPNPPPSGDLVQGGPAPGLPPGTVKLPGSSTFAPITAGQTVPPGTVIDVSNGAAVALTDPKGQTAVFFGETDGVPSVFVMAGVIQRFVELRLTGGDFTVCKSRALQGKPKPGKPVRRLWGKGKGSFRTKGRFASASVRGTWWLTADYCSSTVVTVKAGAVTVRDLVKKKTVVVRAGKSYSAASK